MGMTREGFLKRLSAGKVVNCTYRCDGLAGLISAWIYNGRFILTWEECRDGDQHNENAYTRDARHEFATAEDVISFVEGSGFPVSSFSPYPHHPIWDPTRCRSLIQILTRHLEQLRMTRRLVQPFGVWSRRRSSSYSGPRASCWECLPSL